MYILCLVMEQAMHNTYHLYLFYPDLRLMPVLKLLKSLPTLFLRFHIMVIN